MDDIDLSVPADLDTLRARYLAAQLKGNRREALRLIIDEGVVRGAGVPELRREVIQEAQREIGRLWQENRISIAEEHMATAISQLALAHLYQYAAFHPSNSKKVIVACVEGELHDFPARLVADCLDLAGFEVKFLGASVPTDSLLSMIEVEKPDLVALSVTMTFNASALRTAVPRIRAEASNGLPIVIGGHACQWAKNLAKEVGADGVGMSADEMVALARQILEV